MNDLVDLIEKNAGADLAPDESVLGALVVRSGASAVDQDRTGTAAAFPAETLVLAVTDGRIIGWKRSPLSQHPVLVKVSMPCTALSDVVLDQPTMTRDSGNREAPTPITSAATAQGRSLALYFTDGTSVSYRCASDGMADAFVSAFRLHHAHLCRHIERDQRGAA